MNDLKKAVNAPERLIDGNELTEWLKSKIRECVVLNAHAEAAITEEIIRYVNHMPTVDAIPVEWLREKMRGYASRLQSTELKALLIVKGLWEKEQEAR